MSRNGDENMWKWILLGGIAIAAGAVLVSRNGTQKTNLTFDEFVEELSDKCDELAKKQMKQDSSVLVGGKCELSIMENDSTKIQAVLKLYKKEKASSSWKVLEYTLTRSLSVFSQDESTQMKLAQLKNAPLNLDFETPQK